MQQRKRAASLVRLNTTILGAGTGQISIALVTVPQLPRDSEITRLLASEVTYGMLKTCGEITLLVR
jgi:hypothetical protein